jgi:hypothetical protein
MTSSQSTSGSAFRILCRVLGGQDQAALKECTTIALLQQVFSMAHSEDLLPALAVRCGEQDFDTLLFGGDRADLLKQSLMENTLRNMEISAQALKLTKQLNRAGITPLFLKGTARLLGSESENLGFRKQVDIDLIVQPVELEAAGDAFLADGYRFCKFPDLSNAVPLSPGDTVSAINISAAHHHLPPLVKGGYAATVELHRHFLPKRFQYYTPLDPLFDSAKKTESHGATFYVPSTEYQLIHLLLGKLVHDGHLTRRTFPIREACDLIDILENADHDVDQRLVLQHCGRSFPLFYALVCELTNYPRRSSIAEVEDTSKFTWMMWKSFDSYAIRKALDLYARAEYLAHALAYSPSKLSAYLRRIVLSKCAWPLSH